jgi:aminoglycoside 3-N-acetyltransferase
MSGDWNVLARTENPATRETLGADLRSLGLADGDNVIAHSSLSALGWVNGGAETVVGALLDAVGPEGTLTTPSHSYGHTDPMTWMSPRVPPDWWETIRETMPAFNPRTTPTTRMGKIVETFRTWPGTLRSRHPEVSFCANGAKADFITGDHTYEMGQGDGSPLARLYDVDAKVLFLGVGHDRNTSLHLAEYRIPETPENSTIMLVEENGEREWKEFRQIPSMEDDWLRELGAAFEGSTTINIGRVGLAEARLFSQREAVDFAKGWLSRKWASEPAP